MKILIYSQDGFGLGHLRRNLNICLQIKKRCPQASCLIIADSPAAPFFKLPRHCDFVKIPTIVKVDAGVWRADHLSMSQRELLAIRAEIIQNVATSFQPDIFLVDHMPHGALGELAGPLAALKQFSPHTKVVLGIRDILGAPPVICRQWQNEGAYTAAEAFYDSICVYGCAEVFDVLTEYGFPSALVNKTHYCGYVCREDSPTALTDRAASDISGGTNNGKFVLVTGGGGADAAFFMDQFISAARLLRSSLAFRAVITTGPFMPKGQREGLRKKARNLPIMVSQKGEDSIRYLRRADLTISMAGYNTVSEIMHLRKNAIVVPRPGPSAEQTMRTRIMSGLGLFSTIHPQHLTANNLSELIWQKLRDGNGINEARLPSLNGASRAASLMLEAADHSMSF